MSWCFYEKKRLDAMYTHAVFNGNIIVSVSLSLPYLISRPFLDKGIQSPFVSGVYFRLLAWLQVNRR